MAKTFFDDNLLLHSSAAAALYGRVKALPIVDYHSHLSEREIAEDKTFGTITEFWLKGDHYKWRAMRACGVEERLVTGNADDFEKFLAYAGIIPKLLGNPLYYWTHMELERIFGIKEPLNAATAPGIYRRANEKLKTLSVRKLLKLFGVEYIATTDDPVSPLSLHTVYDGVKVCPTFRPDRALKLDPEFLGELAAVWGKPVETLADFREALRSRLVYFKEHGCSIADISLEGAPELVGEREAAEIFARRESASPAEKSRFFSYGMALMGALCREFGIVWQIHIGALRNINAPAFRALGADTGFDVMHGVIDTDAIAAFLGALEERGELPKVILYALNPNAVPALCLVAGSFKDVRVGAAWWFNDTLKGIRAHFDALAEYSVFGNSLGMLTDSRSFSSYCRFDFFRRILCDYVGEKVEAGEYDAQCAEKLVYDICYRNPKQFMNL